MMGNEHLIHEVRYNYRLHKLGISEPHPPVGHPTWTEPERWSGLGPGLSPGPRGATPELASEPVRTSGTSGNWWVP